MQTQQAKPLSAEVLARQQAYKQGKENFRAKIIELQNGQAPLKEQRKTANFPEGSTRHMSSAAATYEAAKAGNHLRHLYAAYAVFRGRPIPERYWVYNQEKQRLEKTEDCPKRVSFILNEDIIAALVKENTVIHTLSI